MEQGRLMITDFTLLDVATVTQDLTIESIGKHRAYTVKQRVLANEPLAVSYTHLTLPTIYSV